MDNMNNMEWIRCSERMPEQYYHCEITDEGFGISPLVLVKFKDGTICTTHRSYSKTHYSTWFWDLGLQEEVYINKHLNDRDSITIEYWFPISEIKDPIAEDEITYEDIPLMEALPKGSVFKGIVSLKGILTLHLIINGTVLYVSGDFVGELFETDTQDTLVLRKVFKNKEFAYQIITHTPNK